MSTAASAGPSNHRLGSAKRACLSSGLQAWPSLAHSALSLPVSRSLSLSLALSLPPDSVVCCLRLLTFLTIPATLPLSLPLSLSDLVFSHSLSLCLLTFISHRGNGPILFCFLVLLFLVSLCGSNRPICMPVSSTICPLCPGSLRTPMYEETLARASNGLM